MGSAPSVYFHPAARAAVADIAPLPTDTGSPTEPESSYSEVI